MKPKTTILMVLAIGCGLAAAFMTQRLLSNQKQAPEVELVDVVVVKKPVPPQTFIKVPADYFAVEKKSADSVPSSAVRDLANLTNVKVSRGLKEGDYVRSDDVEDKNAIGVPSQLKPGMRAVAIRVNAEKLVGGLVLPTHRVDLVWTYRGANGVPGARTIMQDMEVIAVDTIRQKNNDGQSAIIGQTVTIALKPEEAMELLLAKENGEVSLVIRGVDDTAKLSLKETKIGDVGTKTRGSGDAESTEPETKPAPTGTVVVPTLPATEPKPAEPKPAVAVVQAEPKPVEPKPEPEPKPEEKFHTITVIRGDGEATKWLYPVDAAGSFNVPVKKTELEEPKK